MYLFFDTETTGMIDKNKSFSDPCQPDMVQLAAVLTDNAGNELSRLNTLIRPDGWHIPVSTQKIHGISTEDCQRKGIPAYLALDYFFDLLAKANFLVAHNIAFDEWVLKTATHREGKEWRHDHYETCCTMLMSTPVCKIPSPYGGFKWPNLMVAHEILCGEKFDDAHDAQADVLACKRVFFALKNAGQ